MFAFMQNSQVHQPGDRTAPLLDLHAAVIDAYR